MDARHVPDESWDCGETAADYTAGYFGCGPEVQLVDAPGYVGSEIVLDYVHQAGYACYAAAGGRVSEGFL